MILRLGTPVSLKQPENRFSHLGGKLRETLQLNSFCSSELQVGEHLMGRFPTTNVNFVWKRRGIG